MDTLIIGVIILVLIYLFDYQIKMFLMGLGPIKAHLKKTQFAKAVKYSDFISNYIVRGSKVLDFGTATGAMTKVLRDKYQYQMYPLDVIDQSLFSDVQPELYKCTTSECVIPYEDNMFDCGIAFGVLHHTQDPTYILSELSRTCKMIIICEDIYDSVLGKIKTYVADSIVNFEFKGHPHNNRTDEEWRDTFDALGLRLESADYFDHGVFKHAVYILNVSDVRS